MASRNYFPGRTGSSGIRRKNPNGAGMSAEQMARIAAAEAKIADRRRQEASQSEAARGGR